MRESSLARHSSCSGLVVVHADAEEFPPRQVPVLLNPFREPLASGLELLTCGASQDAWHAVPIWHPEELESQKGEAPLRAWVKTAEPAQMRLLRCHLKVELG